jgi:ADP-heptose:LPS heptosyltransferase
MTMTHSLLTSDLQPPASVLVIRLGALGDLVFCFQSFQDIRRAHPDAEIALLTRAPFAEFAKAIPWFDKVIVDTHPAATDIKGWAGLLSEIRAFAPTRVYDLQGKTRQTILYALLGGPLGPEWSGAAPLCKFPRVWPPLPDMHFTDFLAAQLRKAGIPATPKPDLTWLDAPVEKFALPPQYAVIIPGCSPGAPHKRWPPLRYAELATALQARSLACVAIGTSADKAAVEAIKANAPAVIDLCGGTTLLELAGILRRASVVIGNDTGPIHVAAAVGAPTLALFSGRSNPVWSKPPGERVNFVQKTNLNDLAVTEVVAALDGLSR